MFKHTLLSVLLAGLSTVSFAGLARATPEKVSLEKGILTCTKDLEALGTRVSKDLRSRPDDYSPTEMQNLLTLTAMLKEQATFTRMSDTDIELRNKLSGWIPKLNSSLVEIQDDYKQQEADLKKMRAKKAVTSEEKEELVKAQDMLKVMKTLSFSYKTTLSLVQPLVNALHCKSKLLNIE